jgi:hypothetical protein
MNSEDLRDTMVKTVLGTYTSGAIDSVMAWLMSWLLPSYWPERPLLPRVRFLLLVILVAVLSAQNTPAPGSSKPAPAFETDVLPILQANTCLNCHGQSLKLKNLNLSTYEGVMKGSESGPILTPGRPSDSALLKLTTVGKMPPTGKKLGESDLDVLRTWIESGARSEVNPDGLAKAKRTQHDVIPVMLLHCTICHGLHKQEGGLDLRTPESILKGGKSGPAIVPGKPDASLLVKRLRAAEMPPKRLLSDARVKPLTKGELEKIESWIAQGAPQVPDAPDVAGTPADELVSAKDRQFWAFQPPRKVAPPHIKEPRRVRGPIDAFLLEKLEAKGLGFSPEASAQVLIRRAYFDLTGLPPEPDAVKAFVNDKDPRAYEKLIDSLLASPRYGERWGRYWLDAAGYADSEGGKMTSDDPRPLAWRYRDYVIRAFNGDKPYDRFLLEQIAGDELADYRRAPVITSELMDNLIATGFLRMAPDSTNEGAVNYVDDRVDVIADEMDILTSTVMGLTLRCARCHSHKYDPLPQRDYYRLMAVFQGAYDPHEWIAPLHMANAPGRLLPYVPPNATPFALAEASQEREERNRKVEEQIKQAKNELTEAAEPVRKRLIEERLKVFPPALQIDLRTLAATKADQRTAVQKYLAEKFETAITVSPAELKAADKAYREAAAALERKIAVLRSTIVPESKIRALWDTGHASPAYIMIRGQAMDLGEPVQPGVPSVLSVGIEPYHIVPPWPGAPSTGRRLALARWLIQPNHPLTARVIVNRVWAEHFGQGIVKSVGNFGHAGTQPTQPELLDWLATEFVRQGWSMKWLHRAIMTSSAYRQVSTVTPALEKVDSDNRLLSRMPMTRLDAEALADTLFFVAGLLDLEQFGPPAPVYAHDDGLVEPIELRKGFRRGIYLDQRRSEIPTLWDSFDFPQLAPACLERNKSNVSTQALTMMNDPAVRRSAAAFAGRVLRESGPSNRERVDRAYWIAASRPPEAEEMKASLEMLERGGTGMEQEALVAFCHTLLNSAAFLYVD